MDVCCSFFFFLSLEQQSSKNRFTWEEESVYRVYSFIAWCLSAISTSNQTKVLGTNYFSHWLEWTLKME